MWFDCACFLVWPFWAFVVPMGALQVEGPLDHTNLEIIFAGRVDFSVSRGEGPKEPDIFAP